MNSREQIDKEIGFGILLFLAFFLSRMAVALFVIEDRLFVDDCLDACIKPWQLTLGRTLAGGDTTFLPIALFAATYYFFGFTPFIAQTLTLSIFSFSMALLGVSLRRIFGMPFALYSAGLLLTTLPFITRSVIPTTAPSSFWFFPLVLLVLSKKLTPTRSFFLSLILGASLFAYTAGTILCFSLALCHMIFFRAQWTRQNILVLGCLTGLFFLGAYYIRSLLDTTPSLLHWGLDTIDLSSPLSTVMILVSEMFVSATSWYALSAKLPYANLEIAILLIISMCTVSYQTCTKRTESTKTHSLRWFFLMLMAISISFLLASLSSRLPGIRRVLPSAALLITLSGGFFISLTKRSVLIKRYSFFFAILVLLLSGYRSVLHLRSAFEDLSRLNNQLFVEQASLAISMHRKPNEEIFIGLTETIDTSKTTCGIALQEPQMNFIQLKTIRTRDVQESTKKAPQLRVQLARRLTVHCKQQGATSCLYASWMAFENHNMNNSLGKMVLLEHKQFPVPANPSRLYVYRITPRKESQQRHVQMLVLSDENYG